MIDRDDFSNDESFVSSEDTRELLSLEEQEQNNINDLIENINEADNADENIVASIEDAAGTSDFLERSIPEGNIDESDDRDFLVTKNLKGDNPPGSEQAAFEAGLQGDMSADQVKYQADNIEENFRENLNKTASEIELDKKLKNNEQ